MSDLISREAAVVALANNRCGNDEQDLAVTHDVETIKKIPAVEPDTNREEFYTIYSDREFSYGHGGYETLAEARKFAKPGEFIVHEVVLKDVVETAKSPLDRVRDLKPSDAEPVRMKSITNDGDFQMR